MLVMNSMPRMNWENGEAVPMCTARKKKTRSMGGIDSQYRDAGEKVYCHAIEDDSDLKVLNSTSKEDRLEKVTQKRA